MVNNALHHRNRPNTTPVHDLPLNSKVLIWRENGSWNGLYCLLAVKNKTCYVQFPSRPIRFKNMSIKPYFWPKNTYDTELNKLEATAELDKPKATAEPDELKAPLPTLKVP